jgi:hypothetical protein
MKVEVDFLTYLGWEIGLSAILGNYRFDSTSDCFISIWDCALALSPFFGEFFSSRR